MPRPRPISNPSTATLRRRHYRERQRDGMRVVQVEVPSEVFDAFVEEGWNEQDCSQKDLADSVSDLLDCWRRGTLTIPLSRS